MKKKKNLIEEKEKTSKFTFSPFNVLFIVLKKKKRGINSKNRLPT